MSQKPQAIVCVSRNVMKTYGYPCEHHVNWIYDTWGVQTSRSQAGVITCTVWCNVSSLHHRKVVPMFTPFWIAFPGLSSSVYLLLLYMLLVGIGKPSSSAWSLCLSHSMLNICTEAWCWKSAPKSSDVCAQDLNKHCNCMSNDWHWVTATYWLWLIVQTRPGEFFQIEFRSNRRSQRNHVFSENICRMYDWQCHKIQQKVIFIEVTYPSFSPAQFKWTK